MKTAHAFHLLLILALSFHAAPANAESVPFRVNKAQVDQTQADWLLFHVDAVSMDGGFSYAALEYQAEGSPSRLHEIVDVHLRGSYLIETVSIPRADLPHEKAVRYRWILRDRSGASFESEDYGFYNADTTSWHSLEWRSFQEGLFTYRYALNEKLVRQCAEQLRDAYSFLKAEYGRELPHPVEILFYDGQVHAAMAQLEQNSFAGYASSYSNRITVLSPMRDAARARSFFVHELAHLFDNSLGGAWPADPHALELHATYLELVSDPMAESRLGTGLAAMDDERLSALGSGPGWWYSKYLALGFFESLATACAGGSRAGLSALLYADTGRPFDERITSLAGRDMDALLADAVAWLGRFKDTLPRRDGIRAVSLSIEASREIESSAWIPVSRPAFSDDLGQALISGNYYEAAGEHGEGSVYLPACLDDIMVLDLETGAVRDVSRDPFQQGSPVLDGKGGAYFIGRYGVEYGVYRMDERYAVRERLWSSGQEMLFLNLSGDGSSLVVACGDGMDRTVLYEIGLEDRTARKLGEYAFSVTSMIPDGRSGFFLSADDAGQTGVLYRFDPDTSAMERLSSELDAKAVLCPMYGGSGVLFVSGAGYGWYLPGDDACVRVLLPDPELILFGAIHAADASLTILGAKKTEYFFRYSIMRLRFQ